MIRAGKPLGPPALAFVGFTFVCGCASGAKREAAALSDAIDKFRNASDPIRATQVEAVNAVVCTDARVCDAKKACMEAVDPTTRALALKNEVAVKLGDIEAARLAPDSPEAQALPLKLDEATQLLRVGHKKMDECDVKLTDLRVTYGF